MASLSQFLSYITQENIIAASKHPVATFQTLKAVFFDIPRTCRLLEVEQSEFNYYIKKVRSNQEFNNQISSKLREFQNRLRKEGLDAGAMGNSLAGVLYAIVLSSSPEIVIETGVASGVSSAHILLALEDNGKGQLFSIDLPTERWPLPKGKQPGWLIPEELRHRWTLRLGRSSEILPDALQQFKSVDIFLHDSEHSYENMEWEYQVVWPYLKKRGLLLSHDINANKAFLEFSREKKSPKFTYTGGFGGIVKNNL